LLVLPLQGAVVAFVEAPAAVDVAPGQVGGLERDVRGEDRTLEPGGVDDIRDELLLAQEFAGACAFGAAFVGQGHVDPSGEQILLVPFALAVAQQDEVIRHGSIFARPGAGVARDRKPPCSTRCLEWQNILDLWCGTSSLWPCQTHQLTGPPGTPPRLRPPTAVRSSPSRPCRSSSSSPACSGSSCPMPSIRWRRRSPGPSGSSCSSWG